MIEFKNVTKSYSNNKIAVDGLNLKIDKGQVYGIVGPNGAGKTTIIKMLLGITPVTNGAIYVMDNPITEDNLCIKRKIGYVSDEINNLDYLKGIEYLNFMADIYRVSRKERVSIFEYYADLFELKNDLSKLVKEYSYGMKKKLNIIAALAHKPSILIMDEPFNGLDIKSVYNLKRIIAEYTKNEEVVLLSCHIMELIEKLVDRLAIIHNGKIAIEGSIDRIKDVQPGKSIEEIFLEFTKND